MRSLQYFDTVRWMTNSAFGL